MNLLGTFKSIAYCVVNEYVVIEEAGFNIEKKTPR